MQHCTVIEHYNNNCVYCKSWCKL